MIWKYSEIYWAICKPCGSDWEDRRYIVDQNAHTYEWTEHGNTVLPSKTRLFILLALKPVAQSGSFNEYPWGNYSAKYSLTYLEMRQQSLLELNLWCKDFPVFFPSKWVSCAPLERQHQLLTPMSRLSKHPWGLRQSESQIMNVLFIEQIQKWEPNKHRICSSGYPAPR